MAYFTFTDASKDIFVVEIKDPTLVEHARSLLAGGTEDDPLIAGTIIKAPSAPNVGWSFHLDPASVFFFTFSTEVSDSTMRLIEDDLASVGRAFLPGGLWTPWTSKLVAELAVVSGGDADDVLRGGVHADLLLGGGGDDLLVGERGDDVASGGRGRDTIRGGDGADRIDGGSGVDFLIGGGGRDLIVGGRGQDALMGGPGADTFVFKAGSGEDSIVDFAPRDRIDLRGAASDFLSFADILEKIMQAGDGVVIDLGGGDRVFVAGVSIDQLTAEQFLI